MFCIFKSTCKKNTLENLNKQSQVLRRLFCAFDSSSQSLENNPPKNKFCSFFQEVHIQLAVVVGKVGMNNISLKESFQSSSFQKIRPITGF